MRSWRRVVVAVVVTAGLVAGAVSMAAADPIADGEPEVAGLLVERLVQVDAGLRLASAALPDATVAADAATATLYAARAVEQQALAAAHPVAPTDQSGAGGFADVAATAILDDLQPERATAERAAAELAASEATAQRDLLAAAVMTATVARAEMLTALETSGQGRTRWSVALLDALGAPVTKENLRALSAWIGAEANTARAHNPLATTMGAPGAVALNDHGVKGYPDALTGIDATVRTLRNGSYDAVLLALAVGDSAERVVHAVAASPWGTGENAIRRLRLDA